MSTVDTGLRLTPHEALARDLIAERSSAGRQACRQRTADGPRDGVDRPRRAALLLRSLADRIDGRGA
ncbi:MAG: hypothetical protein JWP82_2392, partial [Humibacillus sp.]|nr:hypothetical protein [Humibacillus sp.]